MFTAQDWDHASDASMENPGSTRHFGLLEAPFASDPDPRFLFKSRSIVRALEHIDRAIRRGEALTVITGEAGTGKTLLSRLVAARAGPRTFVSVTSNPALSCDDLMRRMLYDFGVAPWQSARFDSVSGHDLVRALQQFLSSLAPVGAHAVIVIDDADRLQPEVLERIRLLSNFETDTDKLLQIILLGRPELDVTLRASELRQLEQRISRRHNLGRMRAAEVRQYVNRRLWVAHGGPDAKLTRSHSTFWRVQFTAPAHYAVSAASGGLPRAVNVLSARALARARQHGRTRVRFVDVLRAADLMASAPRYLQRFASRRSLAAAAVFVLGIAGMIAGSSLMSRSDASAGTAATAGSADPAADTVQPTVGALVEIESFTVVAASFSSPERAAALANRAAGLGLPAFTRVTEGTWHQVVVGPYATRDEAREAQQRLDAAEIPDTQIVAITPGSG